MCSERIALCLRASFALCPRTNSRCVCATFALRLVCGYSCATFALCLRAELVLHLPQTNSDWETLACSHNRSRSADIAHVRILWVVDLRPIDSRGCSFPGSFKIFKYGNFHHKLGVFVCSLRSKVKT
jgi:hypothetical protein